MNADRNANEFRLPAGGAAPEPAGAPAQWELDFPYDSLEAAALADLPYSFEPAPAHAAYYRDCFA